MYLLMGLYRPQTGSILIDGVPLGPENTEAMAPQDRVCFAGCVYHGRNFGTECYALL